MSRSRQKSDTNERTSKNLSRRDQRSAPKVAAAKADVPSNEAASFAAILGKDDPTPPVVGPDDPASTPSAIPVSLQSALEATPYVVADALPVAEAIPPPPHRATIAQHHHLARLMIDDHSELAEVSVAPPSAPKLGPETPAADANPPAPLIRHPSEAPSSDIVLVQTPVLNSCSELLPPCRNARAQSISATAAGSTESPGPPLTQILTATAAARLQVGALSAEVSQRIAVPAEKS